MDPTRVDLRAVLAQTVSGLPALPIVSLMIWLRISISPSHRNTRAFRPIASSPRPQRLEQASTVLSEHDPRPVLVRLSGSAALPSWLRLTVEDALWSGEGPDLNLR